MVGAHERVENGGTECGYQRGDKFAGMFRSAPVLGGGDVLYFEAGKEPLQMRDKRRWIQRGTRHCLSAKR